MTGRLNIAPFQEVLEEFRAGRMLIMVDDEKRENEGDIILPADALTPDAVSFMMHEARGLICISISVETAQKLNFPLQTLANNSVFQTPFAVSVDHKDVVARGITASSRALTMKKIVEPSSVPSDFVSPGNVFPLIANPAGVLGRQGQTEGSWDLSRVTGHSASGVLCEILNPDGTMARGDELNRFAHKHKLKITSVADLVRYRINSEVLVREVARSKLSTDFGEFDTTVFIDDADGKEHLALVYGLENSGPEKRPPVVRIHSECLTGDVFGSRRCDCGEQLALAMQRIVAEGCGAIVYLRQEGRGIGLANKVRAYALQDQGSDTVEANVKLGFPPDLRDFAVAAKILSTIGISELRLMTNNPDKFETLDRFGVKIVERIPTTVMPDEYNRHYLETKRTKMGHIL